MKIVLLLCLALLVVSIFSFQDITPLQMTSLQITRENIPEYDAVPFQFAAPIPLSASETQLADCKVIASISEINTVHDPTLSIDFVYDLNMENKTIHVIFTIRSEEEISDSFKMVLDFLVGSFPPQYQIQLFNMTRYQQHLMYDSNRSYELVYFLNGFSNLSLSGNITHSFISEAQMYTVHYMNCIGQDAEMGWNNTKDYLLFTALVMPTEKKIIKFKLYEEYAVDYPSDYRYFYGIKGIQSPTFQGHFQSKFNGVKFEIDFNEPKKAYGVLLIKIPSLTYVDDRVHESSFNILFVLIGVGAVIVIGFIVYWKVIKMQKKILLVEESGRNNHSVTIETSSGVGVVGEASTGVGGFDGKKDVVCDPIEEVSESLEISQPGTKVIDKKHENIIISDD